MFADLGRAGAWPAPRWPVGIPQASAPRAGHRALLVEAAGRRGSVQSADRPGLDAARRPEANAGARAESETLRGRRAVHADRTGVLDRQWAKNSDLFLQLLRRLADAFRDAGRLHVVHDNYGIHSSRLIQWALTEEFHGRIVLHLLPPCSPDHNRIQRLWRELHANVTRNHRCATLPELLRRVAAAFLRRVSPYPATKTLLLPAPLRRAA